MAKNREPFITRMLDRRRYRSAFLAFLYALIVLPIVAVGVFSFRQQERALTDAALSRRGSIAYLAAGVLHEKLDRLSDLALSFATRVRFAQLVSAGNWEEAVAILDAVPRDFPAVERVFLTDKDGTLMVDTPALPGVRGRNFSDRDWYKGVSGEWKPYVSEIYKRAAEPRYNVVAVAAPIRNDAKDVVGIVVLQVRLDTFFDWSTDIDAGPSSFAYFVDSAGNVAGHPAHPAQGEIANLSDDPVVQKVLRGEAKVESVGGPSEAEREIVSYAPVGGYGWGAVVEQPSTAAFAARDATLRYFAYVYAFIALLGLVIAFVATRVLGMLDTYRQKEKIVLDSVGDGLAAIDRGWNITLWNPAAEAITGWSREEAVGRPLRSVLKFIREHDRKENIAFIEHAMVSGERATLENNTLLVRRDGTEIHIGDSASPIKAADGSVAGAIIIFRDVTAERDARSTKSDFAYATHQLRTPVTKASWAIQAAAEEKSPEKTAGALKDAGRALQSLTEVINELAVVSEIDQDMVVPRREDVAAAAIVDAAIAAARKKAGRPDAPVGVEHGDAAEVLWTDPRLLTRALSEVIENAVVYGGGDSVARIRSERKNGDLVFEVSDEGVGIPESERPLVFHKFFRATNIDTTEIVGAGLGLYICERYVRLLGGKVWFKSEPANGTTFYVSVPLRMRD